MDYPKSFFKWCSAKHQENPEVYNSVTDILNHVPMVGHVKGAIHYAQGDSSKGYEAMVSANRSTAVVGGGIAGMAVAGPVGAAAGAASAGVVSDAVVTAVDSQASQAYKPHGIVKLMDKKDEKDKWISVLGVLTWDAFIGTASASLTDKLFSKSVDSKTLTKSAGWAKNWECSKSYSDYLMRQYKESQKLCNQSREIFSTVCTIRNKIYSLSGKSEVKSEEKNFFSRMFAPTQK